MPASRDLPQTTVKALILVVVLSIVLTAANMYLGLFAGLTVSASIPAAVISMAVLRAFRHRNILENNVVQTGTSAGESLAAGVIFTVPALVILGFWDSFSEHWLQIATIGLFAGLLGVVFTIPMRRAFIVEERLRFPEGVATAEVLEAGEGGGGMGMIVLGAIFGAIYKLATGGLRLWQEVLEGGRRVGDTLVYGGMGLSPALLGVGYIVGLRIAFVVFLGGLISWIIAIPVHTTLVGWPMADGVPLPPAAAGITVWSEYIRYLGVGAMAVGGVYALLRLVRPMGRGIAAGWHAFRAARGGATVLRTERDLPVPVLAVVLVVAFVPLAIIFLLGTGSVAYALLMALVMLVAGFLFSSVAGYMAGLVGSSNNPVSGVTIATALAMGALLFLTGISAEIGAFATILVAATIACAAAIAGDNLQDLKAGHLLGATPMRQQVAQMLGVASAALVIPLVLHLLHGAYEIGSSALPAPQAQLIGAVAGSFFGSPIPYTYVFIGAAVALLIILADLVLERRRASFRIPVLAAAVGLYLPIYLTTPILIGGLLAWLTRRVQTRFRPTGVTDAGFKALRQVGARHGVLFASGLIAGEAILGILLAVPIFYYEDPNVLAFLGPPLATPISGALVLLFVSFLIVYAGVRNLLVPEAAGKE